MFRKRQKKEEDPIEILKKEIDEEKEKLKAAIEQRKKQLEKKKNEVKSSIWPRLIIGGIAFIIVSAIGIHSYESYERARVLKAIRKNIES